MKVTFDDEIGHTHESRATVAEERDFSSIRELPEILRQERLEAIQAENRELKQKIKRLRREARKLGARASRSETALFEAMLTLDWVAHKQGVSTGEVRARKLWKDRRKLVQWLTWLQGVKLALKLGFDAGPPDKEVTSPSSASEPGHGGRPRRFTLVNHETNTRIMTKCGACAGTGLVVGKPFTSSYGETFASRESCGACDDGWVGLGCVREETP